METSEEKKCCETKKCCPCRIIQGVYIILIGVIMLLGALDVLSEKTALIWISIIVMLIGLKKICGSIRKCCDKD